MQVMVLEQDQSFQAQLATALMQKGFHVICVESIGAAENFIRMDVVDVLVLGERIGGKLSHSVALLAECRNPMVSAILLTDRTGSDLDEVFDLMPAVYGILGRQIAPGVVAQIVLAAIAGQTSDTVRSRLASRWAAAEHDDVDVVPDDVDDVVADDTADMADLPAVAGSVWDQFWPRDTAPAAPIVPVCDISVCDVPEPAAAMATRPVDTERTRAIAQAKAGWLQESGAPAFRGQALDLPSFADLPAAAPQIAQASSGRRLHLA